MDKNLAAEIPMRFECRNWRVRMLGTVRGYRRPKCMWESGCCLDALKVLMCLITFVYALQAIIIGKLGYDVYNVIIGNGVFLQCLCIIGLVTAFTIHLDPCTWKLAMGIVVHCFCSIIPAAYAITSFSCIISMDVDGTDGSNTVLGLSNIAPSDSSIPPLCYVIPLWVLMAFDYIFVSIIFVSFSLASVHDLLERFSPLPLPCHNRQPYEGGVFVTETTRGTGPVKSKKIITVTRNCSESDGEYEFV